MHVPPPGPVERHSDRRAAPGQVSRWLMSPTDIFVGWGATEIEIPAPGRAER